MCNSLKSPIDLTWDRKLGWVLTVPSEPNNGVNLVMSRKINTRLARPITSQNNT